MADLAPWLAAVPAVGVMIRTLRSALGGDIERRARRHAQLLDAMPESADTAALRETLDAELAEVARRADARLHRKLDGATLAGLLFVAIVAGGGVWLLWSVPVNLGWPAWTLWLSRAGSVFLALFAAGLIAAGAADLFKDSREERPA